MDKKIVITIARGFGSGGRTIGKLLAQRLDIDYYNDDLIKLASEESGINLELFGKADRVICDAPCSGLGVIAKKPEIRYKSLSDFARLPEIQYAILENCSKYVKRGGILVYSTCTVLPEENEMNVERFLSSHPEFTPVDFTVGDIKSEGGMLSLSPDKHGTDGFFVAKFIKN